MQTEQIGIFNFMRTTPALTLFLAGSRMEQQQSIFFKCVSATGSLAGPTHASYQAVPYARLARLLTKWGNIVYVPVICKLKVEAIPDEKECKTCARKNTVIYLCSALNIGVHPISFSFCANIASL